MKYETIKDNISLPSFSFEDILSNHIDIAYELLGKFNLRLSFKEYLQSGYYPFYFEDKQSYLLRLNETINTVIEVDIPSIFPIEYTSTLNLKKLVRLICKSFPYKPNLKELLVKMDMKADYKRFYRFLDYLDKAKVLSALRSSAKGDAVFVKPEKIYLNNTNLLYAYCQDARIGTVRETFFASMLKPDHAISIPQKGDFLVDGRYTFEVGGQNKKFKQIKDLPESFTVTDETEIGSGNKIPLWLFGFLY